MIEALIWLVMFLIAELSKKTGISTTYVLAGLVVVAGGIYTAIEFNNPELIQELTIFVTKSFAVSQGLWIGYNKLKKETSE